jgi:hypothetical protein
MKRSGRLGKKVLIGFGIFSVFAAVFGLRKLMAGRAYHASGGTADIFDEPWE